MDPSQKSPLKSQSNCDAENDQLLNALERYNEYIVEQLKKIEDFDIWYETSFKQNFPKCWYTLIKTGKL
jgi:hypothetical protein